MYLDSFIYSKSSKSAIPNKRTQATRDYLRPARPQFCALRYSQHRGTWVMSKKTYPVSLPPPLAAIKEEEGEHVYVNVSFNNSFDTSSLSSYVFSDENVYENRVYEEVSLAVAPAAAPVPPPIPARRLTATQLVERNEARRMAAGHTG